MTISKIDLIVTLSTKDIQTVMTLSIKIRKCDTQHMTLYFMLSVIRLRVVMLSVVILNVDILSLVAPITKTGGQGKTL
jgi:hypothetical protein